MALTDSEQHPFYGADLKCSFSRVHLRAVAWPDSWHGNETVFSLVWITAQAILRLAKSPARVYVNVSPSLKKQRRRKNVECSILCVCVCVCFNSISDPRYVHSVWKDDQVAGCYNKSCISLVESEI